jgi:Outer membrane protein beta-barrel domain
MNVMKLIRCGAVVVAVSLPGLAQAPWSVSAGYAGQELKASSGSSTKLKGWYLDGVASFTPTWGFEAEVRRMSGDDGEVRLRQNSMLFGPRFSQPIGPRLEWYAHVLVGESRLNAKLGTSQDDAVSLTLSPGLGLEYRLGAHVAVRAQGDYERTNYAGHSQKSPRFTLGLSLKM